MALKYGLILFSTPLLLAADAPALPAWLSGCWEARSDDRWTEECWMSPRGGTMLGASRSGVGDTADQWEAMQILVETDAGARNAPTIALWASPHGLSRTRFARSEGAGADITFRNPDNDYPQRIRYWRAGDVLHAEISLADGSKPMRWEYHRK